MNSKQFAWLYLIENGTAGVEHSYYGGYTLVDQRMDGIFKRFDHRSYEAVKQIYLKELKEIGVDWDKTSAPESNMVSQFAGTFSEADENEYLSGTLILNNGEKQTWIAEAIEVSNVFDMMAAVSEGQSKFTEMFGDVK